jgi:hypothetical protein
MMPRVVPSVILDDYDCGVNLFISGQRYCSQSLFFDLEEQMLLTLNEDTLLRVENPGNTSSNLFRVSDYGHDWLIAASPLSKLSSTVGVLWYTCHPSSHQQLPFEVLIFSIFVVASCARP